MVTRPEGTPGGAVEAMERQGDIVVETQLDAAHSIARVIVADDGPGIPAGEREKLEAKALPRVASQQNAELMKSVMKMSGNEFCTVSCEPVRTPVGRYGGVFKDVPVTTLAAELKSNWNFPTPAACMASWLTWNCGHTGVCQCMDAGNGKNIPER